MSYVLRFSDLTSLTGFLVTFRSINVFDCLITIQETFSFVNSWCLTNSINLACDLKSLSRNVIIQVLFLPLSLPQFRFNDSCKQIVYINEGEGKLALFKAKDNVLLIHPFPLLHNYFISPNFSCYFYFRSSTTSTLHRPLIDPTSTPHLPAIDLTLTVHRRTPPPTFILMKFLRNLFMR